MSKKGSCELCSEPARMLCESDQASLCWDCDEKVHSANFLVAKHTRNLLCHVCFTPTPWKADGLKLGPTISVCHRCSSGESGQQQVSQESENDDGEYDSDTDTDTDMETDYSDENEEEEEEEEEEEDDDENQVVPWTETPAAVASSAIGNVSEEEEEEEESLKRMREDPFEYEDVDDGCCSSQNSDSKQVRFQSHSDGNNTGTSSPLPSNLLRPLKMRRTSNSSDGPSVLTEESHEIQSLKGTAAIVDKLKKLQQEIVTGKGQAVVIGVRKLARDA